jgi:hypothetical protein
MCAARLAGEREGKHSEGGWKTETHYKPKYLISDITMFLHHNIRDINVLKEDKMISSAFSPFPM